MVDYTGSMWWFAARYRVRKLQVLQTKRLRIANRVPSYIVYTQIHEDLGVPFFTDHIRSLTERFDS